MLKAINKPYHQFWLSIPLILGLSIIGIGRNLDLQLHDTYFVIAALQVGILCSMLFGIFGLLYWLLRNKKLFNWMTMSHVAITISAFFIFMIVGIFSKKLVGYNNSLFSTVNQILTILILIALISQLIFLANLVMSLIINNEKN